MDWLISIQRWLYGGMSEGMKSTEDVAGLPSLMAATFVFGIVHALMPGHGKSVLVSYHLSHPSRLLEGVATGTLLALTHVGMAIIFVLAGVAVISRSVAAGGRAPAFEAVNAGLITLIGAYLLYRAVRADAHEHPGDGRALAIAAGFIPCPLTTFILSYALVNNKLATGLAAAGAMLGGVIVTLVSFAVAAVVARQRLMVFLERTGVLRQRIGFWLEFAGAAGVMILGLAMLSDRLARLHLI